MFRALALLLLVAAACLTTSFAEETQKVSAAAGKTPAPAVPKSTPPATKAPVPGAPELPNEAATEPVTAPKKKDGQPLRKATCSAHLYLNGVEDFDFFDAQAIAKDGDDFGQVAWVPGKFDNKITNIDLKMKSEVLKFGSVTSDTHQVMSYTQEIHASGKLSLIVMINTPLPKIELQKAQIVVTCDDFKKFAGVRPEHHHSSFPYDIRTEFNSETHTLIIDVPPITTQHCALLKAVWKLTDCNKGDCCDDDGNFHNEHKMCRYSHNPCKEHTYCTGKHHECPSPKDKDDEETCDWRGDGEHFVATAASHLKHTRMPASAAVSIASTSAAIPSYAEMDECTGRCKNGMCHLHVRKQACCKEILRHGDSYGYGAAPSYGYGKGGNDYDDYGKRDYKGGDDYYGYKGGDDYGKSDGSHGGKYDGSYEGRYGDAGKYDAYAQAAAVDAGVEKDPASEIMKSPIGKGYVDCWSG